MISIIALNVIIVLFTGGLPWLVVRDHDPVLQQRRWSSAAVRLLRRTGRKQVPVHVTAWQPSVCRRTTLPFIASVCWFILQLACIPLFLYL